jgi:uncharacterized membrane protein HdeD (DUF308 family)
MGSTTKFSEFEQRVESQYGVNRSVILAVGIACLLLGGLSVALPLSLYGSLVQLIGVVLLVSGAAKAVQLMLGRRSASARKRGWPVIVVQIVIDVLMGVLLVGRWEASVVVVTTLFGLLFMVEALVLLYMALRAPSVWTGRLLGLTGLLTLGLGVVIVFRLVANPLRWSGLFVGLKLLAFGGTLTWIALRALRTDTSLVYEAGVPEPEPAELYAVYFGTAFHLGVSIGNGEVVHYLNDNHVYRVTWEQFLEGRIPQHWTYPDLEPVLVETVIATALSEVGKEYPYNLFTFNCENFAIFCKSGGKTHRSKYAQIAGSVANVMKHPWIGLVAELNTRTAEWLAFQFGGPAGKHVSLAIRRIGSAVTAWLVDSGARTLAERPGEGRETSG